MGHDGCAALDCTSCCPRLDRCELHGALRREAALGLEGPGHYCAWRFERCCGARAGGADAPGRPAALPGELVLLRELDA
jgi:hypothetical protein